MSPEESFAMHGVQDKEHSRGQILDMDGTQNKAVPRTVAIGNMNAIG